MAITKVNSTKEAIIKVATNMFLEKGYAHTSAKAVCEELGISTGNLTFYFPTKEHILAVLIELLCEFQWEMMNKTADDSNSMLMSVCLEFASMAAICEENETAKDLYLSAYSLPLTLEIIRKSDTERSKSVYKKYCDDWDECQFIEAEILVSGIEYATLMTTDDSIPLDVRISGALNNIMMTYNVPEEERKRLIDKTLNVNYRKIGRRILNRFKKFVEDAN